MPTTVALRFRDFGTDTVAEHNAVVGERGAVWWGWWNKPQERVPGRVLEAFHERIQASGPIEVLLVDSGQERVFKARLAGMAVAAVGQSKAVPDDATLVPAYYRDREWKVWFRFEGPIEPCDVDYVREFSYQEVEPQEFVEDVNSDAYDQKRVHDLREMLDRRHRTMYFLRRRREGDREIEVALVAPDHPVQFSAVAVAADSAYVMVLSDLHFSDEHAFDTAGRFGRFQLADVLDEQVRQHHGGPPAAVLLNGDLTWHGTPEQFEMARSLVSQLSSTWGLHWAQMLAIPGNHDITWIPAEDGAADAEGQAGQPSGTEAEASYRDFVNAALRFPAGSQLSMGRRFLLRNDVLVDIVAVNSCRLEREEYRGYGYVGRDQLREAFAEMGWREDQPPTPRLRVLALHHHVLPVLPVERLGARSYSLTLDAGELLLMALRHGVDLVVHGHQHQPIATMFARQVHNLPALVQRTLPVHGVGSVGVKREHLGAIGRNSYSLVHFGPDTLRVEVWASSEQHQDAFELYWKYSLRRTDRGLVASP